MKTINSITANLQRIVLVAIMFLSSIVALAQDAVPQSVEVTKTTTTTTEEWTSNPVYWALGAIVLIIIIALLTRGRRRD